MAPKCCSVDELLSFALFSSPFPFLRVPIPLLDSASASGIAFSPCTNFADSRHGGVGGGLGSPLAGFSPNTEIRFFDDFSIFTWLLPCFLADIFSSWNCKFCMLFTPLGDGYSLLCIAKKQLLRHTINIFTVVRWNTSTTIFVEISVHLGMNSSLHRTRVFVWFSILYPQFFWFRGFFGKIFKTKEQYGFL